MLDKLIQHSKEEGQEKRINHESYSTDYLLGIQEMVFATVYEIARRQNITIPEAMSKFNVEFVNLPANQKDSEKAIEAALNKVKEAAETTTPEKPTLFFVNYEIPTGRDKKGTHWSLLTISKDAKNNTAVTNINSAKKDSNSKLRSPVIEQFVESAVASVDSIPRKAGETMSSHDFSVNRQHANCCGLSCALSGAEVVTHLGSGQPIDTLPSAQKTFTSEEAMEAAYSAQARKLYSVLHSNTDMTKPVLEIEKEVLQKNGLLTSKEVTALKSQDPRSVRQTIDQTLELREFRRQVDILVEDKGLRQRLWDKHTKDNTVDMAGLKERLNYIIYLNVNGSPLTGAEKSADQLWKKHNNDIDKIKAEIEEITKNNASEAKARPPKPVLSVEVKSFVASTAAATPKPASPKAEAKLDTVTSAPISFLGKDSSISKPNQPKTEAQELAELEVLMGTKPSAISKPALSVEVKSSVTSTTIATPKSATAKPASPRSETKSNAVTDHEELMARLDKLGMKTEQQKMEFLSRSTKEDGTLDIKGITEKLDKIESAGLDRKITAKPASPRSETKSNADTDHGKLMARLEKLGMKTDKQKMEFLSKYTDDNTGLLDAGKVEKQLADMEKPKSQQSYLSKFFFGRTEEFKER